MKPHKHRALQSCRRTWLAAAFLFGLLVSFGHAIPLEIQETELTLTLPEGFEEVSGTNGQPEPSRLFVRRVASNEQPSAYLTIRRLPAYGAPDAWQTASNTEHMTVLGRYSESLNAQNVAIMLSETVTNDSAMIEQSARVPITAHTILLDLKLHTNDNSEAQALMRKIIQSMAMTTPSPPAQQVSGWMGALAYVALAVALLVVAIARR
jgi:hypothetical protein